MERFDGLDEFVSAHSAELIRVAYLLTGDRGDAQDLLQSALVKVALRWPRLRAGNPAAYIRRTLYTEAISAWRYRQRRPAVVMARVPERAGAPDVSEQTVHRVLLAHAMRQLTPRQRAILVLRFYEDRSEADTAATLGCTVGTVKSLAHRALIKLRELVPDPVVPRSMPGSRETV